MVRPIVDDPNPPKDANEALLAGRNIQEFLDGEISMQYFEVTAHYPIIRHPKLFVLHSS